MRVKGQWVECRVSSSMAVSLVQVRHNEDPPQDRRVGMEDAAQLSGNF